MTPAGRTALGSALRREPLIVAPEVRRDYGFSLAGVGLLSTVFTLGMAVAGVPTSILLARLSRRTVLLTGIALFSAGTALFRKNASSSLTFLRSSGVSSFLGTAKTFDACSPAGISRATGN